MIETERMAEALLNIFSRVGFPNKGSNKSRLHQTVIHDTVQSEMQWSLREYERHA